MMSAMRLPSSLRGSWERRGLCFDGGRSEQQVLRKVLTANPGCCGSISTSKEVTLCHSGSILRSDLTVMRRLYLNSSKRRGLRASITPASRQSQATTSSPLAIIIRKLNVSVTGDKGEVAVLKECSLNVPEGQFWMLLGPNGCGKSTLLKAMAGLLKPNSGSIYVIGPRSFVFQNPDYQVVMPTVEADVAFGLGRYDLSIDEVRDRVHRALAVVGLAGYSQRNIQTLSGGQKQRIAIAGALAEASRLLLLDELTTFLDRSDQIGVLEAVRKVSGGMHPVTALWVTHRLEELDYADGAAYMENGKVVFSGSVAEMKSYLQSKRPFIGDLH